MDSCRDEKPVPVCSVQPLYLGATNSCCNEQPVAVCTIQSPRRAFCINGTDNASSLERMMAILNFIAHLLILGVCLYVSIICFQQKQLLLFKWHPFCMTIGLFGCSTMAIMLFSKYNLISCRMEHQTRFMWHWITQGIAIFFITAGFSVIVENKNILNKPHFTSGHGIIGLIAFIMILMTFIIALLVFIGKCICRKITRRMQLLIHITLAVVTYIISILVLLLGLTSEWFIATAGLLGAVICCVLVILVATHVLWSPLSRKLSNVDKAASSK